jgi:hypothetical protein
MNLQLNRSLVKTKNQLSFFSNHRIYIYTKVETEETIQDMLDKYNIATNDKGAKVKLLRELLRDYKQKKEKVFKDIQGEF